MFNRARTSLAVVAISLGLAQAAHADLSAPLSPGQQAPVSKTLALTDAWASPLSPAGHSRVDCFEVATVAVATRAQTGVAMTRLALGLPQDGGIPFLGLSDEAAGSSTGNVIELPPAPSSMALFLSALLSAGAWHVCRSAKHSYANGLPDWYHAGAPQRIGHVVVYDPVFNAAPLCLFEQPVSERPFLYRVRREHIPQCDARSFLIAAAPRGPPSTS